MKKLFLLSVAATLISSLSYGKVWRVNNIPAVNTNFATVADAQASTSVKNGDTLHIESSPTSYGDVQLEKQLTLIGAGYFLNTDPAAQFNVNSPTFGTMVITVPNVNIYGLTVASLYLYGPEYNGSASNILINRNNINTLSLNGTMNTIYVSQNIVLYVTMSHTVTDLLFTNNLANRFDANGSSFGVIEYNVFGAQYYYSQINLAEGNFSVNGNIIKGTPDWLGSSVSGITNSVLGYNMMDGNTLPAGSGNQNNVDMSGANVFVDGTVDGSGLTTDTKFQLSASSPAKTAGAGGTPIGAFGGGSPYRLSGIPPIPSIYKLFISTAIATGTSIPVTFSSKSNN